MENIAIIGAGVAGYTAAIELSSKYKITIYEKNLIGGTCVNRGCIPVKYLVHRRDLLTEIKKAHNILKNNIIPELDMTKLQIDKDEKIKKIRENIITNLKKHKIELIKEKATIKNNFIITENTKKEFDKIIIATGSKPYIDELENIFSIKNNAPLSICSDDFINIDNIPKKLAVIGGGYIGIELASIFSSFGSKVTVFEKASTILQGFEKASTKSLEFRLKKNGLNFIKNAEVKTIESDGTLTYVNKNNELNKSEDFNHIVISIGRKVNTVPGIEVEKQSNGFIKVNKNYETSIKNVYAIGDVIGPPFFAHRSARQAYLLSWHLLGKDIQNKNENIIPEVVFTDPEMAKVGMDEDQLKEKNIDYKIHRVPYGVLGKSVILDENGMLKIITDKNGKILGSIIIGKAASELIGYMALSISKNMYIYELQDITMPHPTLSELFLEVGLRYK